MNHLLESLIVKAKKDPTPRVFFRICEEYRKVGDYQKIIEYGLMGLECDEHHLPTLLVVGKSYSELNQLEKGTPYFQKVLEMDSENTRAIFGMASCLIGLGFSGEAKPFIENLRMLQPSLVEELQLTGTATEENTETEEAVHEEEQIDMPRKVVDPVTSVELNDIDSEQTISLPEQKLLRLKTYLSKIRSNCCV